MNLSLFHTLNNLLFQNTTFDSFIYFIAVTFPYCVVGSAFLFLLLYPTKTDASRWLFGLPRRVAKIVHVFFATGVTYLIVSLIKHIVAHPRPFQYITDMKSLFVDGGFDSFPSGHASAFMALGVALWYHHRTAGVFLIISAILIGIARIIGGVHFPIDILVGWLIGLGIALVANHIWKKISQKVSTE
jgi:undecaprenyl-diphosphatase